MADILDRRGADRAPDGPARRAPHQAAARFRVLIEFAEFLPVAAIGECGQRQLRHARFLVRGFRNVFRRREPLHARKSVIPPGAVVVTRRHRFSELTVVGNVDAELALLAHDIGDRGAQALRVGRIVFAFAGKASAAHGDKIGRPREAAGMRGQNPVLARSHSRFLPGQRLWPD